MLSRVSLELRAMVAARIPARPYHAVAGRWTVSAAARGQGGRG